MKKITHLVAAFALACIASNLLAQNNNSEKGTDDKYSGAITAITDKTITVVHKKRGEKVIRIGPDTQVFKIDKSPGTLSDLTVGTMVRITLGGSPVQAMSIKVFDPEAKQEPAPAAPPQ